MAAEALLAGEDRVALFEEGTRTLASVVVSVGVLIYGLMSFGRWSLDDDESDPGKQDGKGANLRSDQFLLQEHVCEHCGGYRVDGGDD